MAEIGNHNIKIVQLSGGGLETWTRTLNTPLPGDVTFTGSLGSLLVVPSSTSLLPGDADSGLVVTESGGANGGDLVELKVDGITVFSGEILAGGLSKVSTGDILDPIIYRPTPQTTAQLTALIPSAVIGDIAFDSTLGYHVKFDGTIWTPIVSVNKSIQYTTYNDFKTDAATVFSVGDYVYISNPAEYLQVTVGGTGFAAITTQSLWDLKQGRALAEGAQFDTSFTPDSKLYGNEYFTLISSTASDPLIVSDLQNDGGAAIPGIGERYSFLFFNNDTVAHDVQWGTGWKTSTGGVKADITVDPNTQVIVEFIGTHVGGIPEFREVVIAAESKVIVVQWQPSTVYATGEVVWDPSNSVYIKRGVSGTSGLTLDNTEKTAWEPVSSYGINSWTAATYYHEGQDVTYANKVLRQVAAQVSNATFNALESVKWQLISSQVLAWSASTFYYAGEEVNNNGVRYQKASSGVSGITFDATEEANWLRVGEYSSNPKVISATNYTVLANDGIISVDSALNDVNIELPAGLPNGKFFVIHYQKTTNDITITAGAGTDVVDPTTYLPVSSFVLPGSAGQIGTTQFFKLNTTWNFLG